MERERHSRATFALAAAVLAALAGCTPTPERPPDTRLPDGITISVFQTRNDFAARKLEIEVANDSARDFVIEQIAFETEQFVTPAQWTRGEATIRAGVTTNLPVQLPAANCEAVDAAALVTLTYRLPGGESRAAQVEPIDKFDRLAPLFAEECFEETVATIATVLLDSPLRTATVGGRPIALVDLAISPAENSGSLTINSVGNTTLLQLADARTGLASSAPLNVRVDGGGEPSILSLAFIPARCDPHAIAEDKRGTILPLTVTLDDGSTGVVNVATSDEVKFAIYDFVKTSCGLPES